MVKGKIYLLLIFVSIAGQIDAQWFLPPYKIELKDFPYGDFRKYWREADLDGNGKNEIITREAHGEKSTIEQIKFFTLNDNLIDAFNAGAVESGFTTDFILSANKKDYYLIGQWVKHKVILNLIYINDSGNFVHKIIYSFPSVKKTPISSLIYFHIPDKNILIIAFSVNFPWSKDFRRLVAFDTKNFNILWEKLTADIPYDFVYSQKHPESFYYGTVAYSNGLISSRNAFYQLDNDLRPRLDTALCANPLPYPDKSSRDYAADTTSYIVQISLSDGKEIWRKKFGGAFSRIYFQREFADSSVYFNVTYRTENVAKFYRINFPSNKITKLNFNLKKENPKIEIPVMLSDKFIIHSTKNNTKIYTIENDSLTLVKTITPAEINSFEKFRDIYLISAQKDYYVVLDSNFNLLGNAHLPSVTNNCPVWSKTFQTVIFANYINDISYLLHLRKLPFYKRFSPYLKNLILLGTIIVLVISLIFWFITMRISRNKLKRKNRELEEATFRLVQSEKLALLGTIAASFAHQLNSPLGAIINSAERLSNKISDENLKLIQRSAEYSKTLVQKFLDSSRKEKPSETPCVSFSDIWNDWYAFFKEETLKRKISVIIDFNDKNEKIAISKDSLFEIISNLLFNARDSILAANKKEKFIKISTEVKNDKIHITIEDSGHGFPDENIENIFEPFYSTKTKGKGTGLGLWIVKKLLENAGGEIIISNTVNGALVKLILNKCGGSK